LAVAPEAKGSPLRQAETTGKLLQIVSTPPFIGINQLSALQPFINRYKWDLGNAGDKF